MEKKLYKDTKEKKLCGVCGGVAEYFELDPTVVRIGWVILALCASLGFWAYVICAIVMPKKSDLPPEV